MKEKEAKNLMLLLSQYEEKQDEKPKSEKYKISTNEKEMTKRLKLIRRKQRKEQLNN